MDLNFIVNNWSDLNKYQISRSGTLIRKIMRGSIRRATRYRKTRKDKYGHTVQAGMLSQAPSPPGKPPRARYGMKTFVRPGTTYKPPKNIPFKMIYSIPFEDGTRAVIGHVLMPIKKQDPRKTPMQAHEFGERVKIRTKDLKLLQKITRKRARTEKQRRAARKKFLSGQIPHTRLQSWKNKIVRMPKRPFALPALQKAKKKIGQFWHGCLNPGTVKRIKKFPPPRGKI